MKKDLPESKPEKNCGNCVNKTNWPMISHTPCNECYMASSWQPKPAEPQGWEQRFDKQFPHCGGAFQPTLSAFIRADIERVRLEEQNKHREG